MIIIILLLFLRPGFHAISEQKYDVVKAAVIENHVAIIINDIVAMTTDDNEVVTENSNEEVQKPQEPQEPQRLKLLPET